MSNTPFTRPLRGIVPPLVTPLKEQDVLDEEGLRRLLEHLLAGGVTGLFILGTTGEGPSLSYRLRYELVDRTCEFVAGRAPVLVGITDTCLPEALTLARFAEGAGAHAVVAAPPYYFPAGDDDLTAYFRRLADRAALPLLLYNIPACTRNALSPAVLRACAGHPRVVGVKDSSGDLNFFRQLLDIRQARPDWTALMGPEHLLADAVRLGGDGGVNGGALLHPRLFVDLFAAADRGDAARVADLQAQAESLGDIYRHGPPVASVVRGIKCALALLGLCDNVPADPLRPLSAQEQHAVADRLRALGLLTHTGDLPVGHTTRTSLHLVGEGRAGHA